MNACHYMITKLWLLKKDKKIVFIIREKTKIITDVTIHDHVIPSGLHAPIHLGIDSRLSSIFLSH